VRSGLFLSPVHPLLEFDQPVTFRHLSRVPRFGSTIRQYCSVPSSDTSYIGLYGKEAAGCAHKVNISHTEGGPWWQPCVREATPP
jgi:hypothetical protein